MLARRIALGATATVPRRTLNKMQITSAFPGNIHTVNEDAESQLALEQHPDRNIEYVNSIHDLLVARPFMLGREGTQLHALRQKELGDWTTLSKEEQLALYRGAYKSSVPEMWQSTDLWKGAVGFVLMAASALCLVYEYSYRAIHGEEPKKSGLWYMYGDGWQQHRKNTAAYHLFWENETIEGRSDVQWWDYTNHVWKNPQWVRFDHEE